MYIVLAYSKLSYKIQAGGVADFMGGPSSCLIILFLVELILGWKGGNAFTLIVT